MSIGTGYNTTRDTKGTQPMDIPAGTAVVLSVIWITMSVLAVFLFLQIWPASILPLLSAGSQSVNAGFNLFFILGILALVNAAPLIVAYAVTKIILRRES